MIRKVKTSALKPGVFIHDYLCDKSKENIHLEQSFLKDMHTINILLSWGIKEVLIDTDRGIDIRQTKQTTPSQYNRKESADEPATSSPNSITSTPETLSEELPEAKIIKDDAVRFINNSMDQIVIGKFPDLSKIYNLVRRMQHSIERSIDALSLLTRIRQKDEYTLVHSISVSTLMLRMCRYLNIPSDHALHLAIGALFHDIGKAEIDEKILNKPGVLTDQEFNEMKKHAQKSAEVLKDVSFRIVPLVKRDASEMIRELKGYPILEGYRGQEPANTEVLEDLLLKVSDFVEGRPEIKEMDINPIFAYSDGALAVDARIILESE